VKDLVGAWRCHGRRLSWLPFIGSVFVWQGSHRVGLCHSANVHDGNSVE